jgi:hypothetical protein
VTRTVLGFVIAAVSLAAAYYIWNAKLAHQRTPVTVVKRSGVGLEVRDTESYRSELQRPGAIFLVVAGIGVGFTLIVSGMRRRESW